MLQELTVKEFIEKCASGEPTPGGGSVGALAGSLGAALNVMVYNLMEGKKLYNSYEEELRNELDESAAKLKELSENLLQAMEDDTKAFDSVIEAFGMPKETEEEKEKRSEAVQAGYRKALEVPLQTAKTCAEALFVMEVFSLYGNKNAISDIGVGALLAYSGCEASILNVKINLNSIKDEEYRKDITKQVDEMLSIAKTTQKEILDNVYNRLAE